VKPAQGSGEVRASTRRLRALFVDSQSELGGAGFALLTLLEALDRVEVSPFYASLAAEDPEIRPHIEALGIPTMHVRAGRFRSVGRSARAILELRRLMRKSEIDVVVANSGHPLLYVRPAALATGCPCAWWVHGYAPVRATREEPIARAQRMLSADLLLANSEFTAQQLSVDFPRGPLHVLRPAVNLSRFRPDPAAGALARRSAGLPEGQPVIGIFGRLQRWKGQHIFLRAAALLAGRGVKFSAIVAGSTMFGIEPEYADELKRLAADPSLTGRIHFLGNRDNPQDWMNACDVVVHASVEPEPWGLVVAEGMACGRAVLASEAGGPLEMIDHKRTGWLAAPGDEVALATWLEILLANPALRAELGAAARRHAETEFDPRRAAAALAVVLWRLWAAKIEGMQMLPELAR
jgi:glycosyltransferase involved in cell wall biosynthesis